MDDNNNMSCRRTSSDSQSNSPAAKLLEKKVDDEEDKEYKETATPFQKRRLVCKVVAASLILVGLASTQLFYDVHDVHFQVGSYTMKIPEINPFSAAGGGEDEEEAAEAELKKYEADVAKKVAKKARVVTSAPKPKNKKTTEIIAPKKKTATPGTTRAPKPVKPANLRGSTSDVATSAATKKAAKTTPPTTNTFGKKKAAAPVTSSTSGKTYKKGGSSTSVKATSAPVIATTKPPVKKNTPPVTSTYGGTKKTTPSTSGGINKATSPVASTYGGIKKTTPSTSGNIRKTIPPATSTFGGVQKKRDSSTVATTDGDSYTAQGADFRSEVKKAKAVKQNTRMTDEWMKALSKEDQDQYNSLKTNMSRASWRKENAWKNPANSGATTTTTNAAPKTPSTANTPVTPKTPAELERECSMTNEWREAMSPKDKLLYSKFTKRSSKKEWRRKNCDKKPQPTVKGVPASTGNKGYNKGGSQTTTTTTATPKIPSAADASFTPKTPVEPEKDCSMTNEWEEAMSKKDSLLYSKYTKEKSKAEWRKKNCNKKPQPTEMRAPAPTGNKGYNKGGGSQTTTTTTAAAETPSTADAPITPKTPAEPEKDCSMTNEWKKAMSLEDKDKYDNIKMEWRRVEWRKKNCNKKPQPTEKRVPAPTGNKGYDKGGGSQTFTTTTAAPKTASTADVRIAPKTPAEPEKDCSMTNEWKKAMSMKDKLLYSKYTKEKSKAEWRKKNCDKKPQPKEAPASIGTPMEAPALTGKKGKAEKKDDSTPEATPEVALEEAAKAAVTRLETTPSTTDAPVTPETPVEPEKDCSMTDEWKKAMSKEDKEQYSKIKKEWRREEWSKNNCSKKPQPKEAGAPTGKRKEVPEKDCSMTGEWKRAMSQEDKDQYVKIKKDWRKEEWRKNNCDKKPQPKEAPTPTGKKGKKEKKGDITPEATPEVVLGRWGAVTRLETIPSTTDASATPETPAELEKDCSMTDEWKAAMSKEDKEQYSKIKKEWRREEWSKNNCSKKPQPKEAGAPTGKRKEEPEKDCSMTDEWKKAMSPKDKLLYIKFTKKSSRKEWRKNNCDKKPQPKEVPGLTGKKGKKDEKKKGGKKAQQS